MNKIVLLMALMFCFVSGNYAQLASSSPSSGGESKRLDKFNFTSFTDSRAVISHELDSLTSKQFKSHPEYGINPYNAPCKDCFELLQKRDERHRYYVIAGSKGKEFYQETSYSRENYYDESGQLLSIDPRIKPTTEPGVFKASRQPLPVTINVPQRFTSILVAGKELKVNRDVTLYIKHKDGSLTSLGQPSWSDYTAGGDGVVIHNFYPGIDLEMRVQQGAVESSYRINKPLDLGDGWLVVHDNVALPVGCSYDYSYSEKRDDGNYAGMLCINNEAGARYFIIASPAAYDINKENNNAITLPYHTYTDNAYEMYVPVDWMNSAERSYPLVIDPFVIGSDTLPETTITGSGYNATCFLGGCQYDLDLNVPAATTVTDIRYTFYYEGLGTCDIDQGAFDLTYAGCRSPKTAGTWHTCTIHLPGVCQSDSLSCFTDVQSCIPPPQCKSYDMPFVLTFYRCVSPNAGCGFSCITAETDWVMFVRGYYINVTAHDTSVCQGSSVNLTAVADSGISPYTYTWYPGGLVGNPVSVSPNTTTTYTVTAKDCQPGLDTLTDSAQVTCTVTVYQNDNPGFTVAPNPVCPNTTVTITGLGVAPNTSYDWSIPNGNPIMVNGQQSFTVTYTDAGNYNITLHWKSPVSGCTFSSSMPITVNANTIPTVSIVANPPGAICPGTNVTFTATVNGGGANPTYQWYIDGNPVAGATSNPFSSTTLNNGDVITVHIISDAVCPLPDSAVSTPITMQVDAHVAPAVTIAAAPSGPICPGTNVTFTATPANQGTNPTYQWYLNGGQTGAGGTTYSSSTLNNGDIITVHLLNSNAPCVLPDSAVSDTITVVVQPNVAPSVTISVPSTTICAGDNVTFTATPANGGNAPVYQWYIDGNPVSGATSNQFSSTTLNNGDVITVHLLNSNLLCVSPDTAVSNAITMVVNPLIVPSVTIAVVPSNTICAGANVTFTATPANQGTNPGYQWYVNGNPVGTSSTTYSSTTLNNGDVITVHLLNSNVTCPSPDSAVSNQIVMDVIPQAVPAINIPPVNPICPGDNITFTATPSSQGTNPSYQWYVNGVAVGTNNPSYSSTGFNNGDMVSVHLLNSNVPCVLPDSAVSDTVTVVVMPNVVPSVTIAGADTICPGQNVTFTSTPTNGGSNPGYQWYVNGAAVAGANSSSYSYTGFNNGDVVSVHLLNSNVQCIVPDTAVSNAMTIVYNPPVIPAVTIAAAPPGIICQGQTVTFTATETGGGPSPSYQWYVNARQQGTNSSTFSSSAWKNGDIVTVVLTSNDPCANPLTATSNPDTVQMYPAMTVFPSGDTTICPGESVPINSVAGGGEGPPYSYSWTNGAGNDSSATVTPSATTLYTVSATDACNSTPATGDVTVTVSPVPVSNFSFSPSEPTEYSRTVYFTDRSSDAISWNWNFGDSASASNTNTAQNPSHTFSGIGTYTITLIVINAAKCTDSISYTVDVTEEYAYYIPNAFTPNGDGHNDYFGPIGTHDLVYTMTIYDRWGEKIFETDNSSLPWNGQVAGSDKIAEAGVYVYRVTFLDSRYTSNVIVGSVTLVR